MNDLFANDAAFARPDYVGGDYLYENQSPKLRTGLVAPDAYVWLLSDHAIPDSQIPLTPTEAAPLIEARGFGAWTWIIIEDGLIIEFWEPWDS